MKKYKKVYLEITNRCNLSCDFCIKNKRVLKDITIKEFNFVLEKLKPITNYLYFHILGEPLIHPQINELIDIASKDFYINITTNGYFIDKIKDNKNIRQVNISLHSFDSKYHITLEEYLNNIFNSIDKLITNNTYISLRLWVKTKYHDKIIKYINNKYNCSINLQKGSFKVNDHLFINDFREFIWPDLDNNYYNEQGTCYGLIDHFGVLTDGTIVPCCLDTKGTINLGNIYKDDLNTILNSPRCQKMIAGFKQNKKCENLCKHCSFIEKGSKSKL